MVKTSKKTLILIAIITLSLLSIPNKSLAFFGLFSTPSKIKFFIPTSFISNYIFPGFTDKKEEKPLNIVSGSYLLGNTYIPDKKTSLEAREIYWVTATAYSSTVDQTDDSPFITASGLHVHDGTVAANFLPLGTLIKIPDIYGDKIFIIEDRMNKRYGMGRIDLWFPERELAKNFGVKKVKIEIVS